MMQAERPRRAVVEAMARDGYRERYPDGRPSVEPPANVQPALFLLGAESRILPYRGRGYVVGHVSFEDGIRLTLARSAVEALDEAAPTPENTEAYLLAMRLIVRLAPRYLVPIETVRRFFWRLGLRRNPFKDATEREVGQLLGFFLVSRTRSRVQFSANRAGPPDGRTS